MAGSTVANRSDISRQTTDDGVNYTYVFDAWGRLKRVKNRSTTHPIIEYTYNGLGYRISERTDSDSDNDIDANDEVDWFQHDDRWRIVAVYRNTNANATERYVWHMAGVAGVGSSSYIDSMVLRDRDAAADGTYEVRRGVLRNWRAGVSCIIEDDGEVIEWVRYTPYGVAYSIPWVNADRNGDDGIDDLGDGDFANDIRHEHIKERRCLRADAGGTGSSGSVPRTDATPASRTDDAYTAGASVQKGTMHTTGVCMWLWTEPK